MSIWYIDNTVVIPVKRDGVITLGSVDPWFDSLYEKNAQKLFHIANHILHNRSVAEELVQDTFTVLLIHRKKVKTYQHPEAFLLNVLKKRIGSEMQRASYKREEPLEEKHEAIAAVNTQTEQLEDILPEWLTPQERQLLLWRIDDELSFQEIALRLGCSEHACHAKMYRLREKFKKFREKS